MEQAQEKDKRTWKAFKIVLILALVVLALLFSYRLRTVLNPLLVAFLLAYIFNPSVTYFERKGVSRTLSILSLYAVMILMLFIALYLGIPALSQQTLGLLDSTFKGESFEDQNHNARYDTPEPYVDRNKNNRYDKPYVAKAVEAVADQAVKWNLIREDEKATLLHDLTANLRKGDEHQAAKLANIGLDFLKFILETVQAGISGFLMVLFYALIVPIYMFFILKNMNQIWRGFTDLLPAAHKDRWLESFRKIHAATSTFFRGQVTIGLIKGMLLFAILWSIGINFSLVFGFLYGITCIVPYLGILIGASTTVLYVIVDLGLGMPFLLTVGALVVLELIDGFVLTPILMGRRLGLHPLEVILSIFIFGELFGFFGLLLAIPLAAAIKILFRDHILPVLKEPAAHDPAEAR